jgi:hypothetical protein
LDSCPLGALIAARSGAYYKPCGTFDYKGTHKLFKHAYSCDKAKKKAKYVIKRKRAPRGWTCSLDELPNGFAACQQGRKAFSFVPFTG